MPLPANVTIDKSEQGSNEWHLARLGKFTASRAAEFMRKQRSGKPYASRQDYIMEVAMERITGKAAEQYVSKDMQRGIDMEATAALAYSFKTGNEVSETGFHHFTGFNIGASPDRIIPQSDGIVEIKNPKATTHFKTLQDGEIPEYYRWQIIQQLWLTGAKFADYVSYRPDFPENSQLYINSIIREEVEEDIEDLKEALLEAEEDVNEIITFLERFKQ